MTKVSPRGARSSRVSYDPKNLPPIPDPDAIGYDLFEELLRGQPISVIEPADTDEGALVFRYIQMLKHLGWYFERNGISLNSYGKCVFNYYLLGINDTVLNYVMHSEKSWRDVA